MPDNASIVKSAVEAFNGGQADGVKKAFHRNTEKGALESMRTLRTAFPDLQYAIDHIQADGDQVMFTYTVKGTHRGELGDLKATNKAAQWHGWGVATVENGVITNIHTKDDWVRAGIQLGILNPSAAGTWTGASGNTTVTLVLTQTGATINGTATMSGLADSFPVSGTNNYPDVDLRGTAFGLQVVFDGAFNGANTIAGSLTVQGFPPQQVTLTRKSAR
jgi:predicted ester cyclase